jgi:small-conductance mechanosensitive channel
MHIMIRAALCVVFSSLFAASPAPVLEPAATPVGAADVLAHLERTISWYRKLNAVERFPALANDVLRRETARRMSIHALQLAFDFARAQAALLTVDRPSAEPPVGSPVGRSGRSLEQVAARATERVARLEARIRELDSAVVKAAVRARPILIARRKQALAELELAEQIQGSAKGLVAFMDTVGAANNGLAGRIDQLERSVPDALRRPSPGAQSSPLRSDAASAPPFHPESAGIFGLATELFTLTRAKTDLKHAVEETEALLKSVAQLRAPLSGELRTSIRRSDEMAAASASDDPAQLAAGQREVEALIARFKRISAALTPLREERILVESSRGNLTEWQNELDARHSAVAGYLVMRASVLAFAIGALLVISELWRRMTFRYARDARRRRQFLVLRRIVVGCAIALVVVLGFLSEVGSLATYAGFLTAGLAVALQNPILSFVAYFFLIGRYGLRVGDRVTISGVTGDIIEIGLVRIYLMELTGPVTDLHPTGRVVAFSNAVLFQPAALFKQMPGTDYVWRTATLRLSPDCDAQLAESKLMAAVESVYDEYRESIEQQHAVFERSVDMKVSPPRPQGRVTFSETGLEFLVQYPAQLSRGPVIDERIRRALQAAMAQDPALALAPSGEPRLEASV